MKQYITYSVWKNAYRAYAIDDIALASRMGYITKQAELMLSSSAPRIEIFLKKRNFLAGHEKYSIKPDKMTGLRPVILTNIDFSYLSDEEIKVLIVCEYLRSAKMISLENTNRLMAFSVVLLILAVLCFPEIIRRSAFILFNGLFLIIAIMIIAQIFSMLQLKAIDKKTVEITGDAETFISALEKSNEDINFISIYFLKRRITKIRKKYSLSSFIR
jgi:hypothetical protein